MSKQIGTKEIVVNGQRVTVRVFAGRQSRNEDAQHATRLADVRYQTTREDYLEMLEMRQA